MTAQVLAATERVVEVIQEARSIADQVLEIPVGSTVVATLPDSAGGDALLRTGRSGWQTARTNTWDNHYGSPDAVREWVKTYERQGYTFTLVTA